MSQSGYRVRRATVDDLSCLQLLWAAMHRQETAELERRLTEFQLVETESGNILGALAMEVSGRHGRLHSESFHDFGLADTLRDLLWERMKSLSASQGLARLWIAETAPFWKQQDFIPAKPEALARMPAAWKTVPQDWLTLELRDEEALRVSLETTFNQLKQEAGSDSQAVMRRARVFKYVSVALGIIVALAGALFSLYIIRHNPNLLRR